VNKTDYHNSYTDEHGTEVEIRMKTEHSSPDEMTEALHFMASCSQRFYLDVAEQLKA